MDAEQLRAIYNERFAQERNNWSSVDPKKTMKVARRTMRWLKTLGFQKTSARLLDVGCATGFYTESFRRLGCQVVGLDYSEVALEKARSNFPECAFVQMNGFAPHFDTKFDVIFCMGFSGTNTHDLAFMAEWINRYMELITPGGFFILSYTSNFSGKERAGEIANLSIEEIHALTRRIHGAYRGMRFFHYFGLLSRLKKAIERGVLKKDVRHHYSIFIQNNDASK